MSATKRVYVNVTASPDKAIVIADEEWNVLHRGASITIWGASSVINTKGAGFGVSYSIHTEATLTVYDRRGAEIATL